MMEEGFSPHRLSSPRYHRHDNYLIPISYDAIEISNSSVNEHDGTILGKPHPQNFPQFPGVFQGDLRSLLSVDFREVTEKFQFNHVSPRFRRHPPAPTPLRSASDEPSPHLLFRYPSIGKPDPQDFSSIPSRLPISISRQIGPKLRWFQVFNNSLPPPFPLTADNPHPPWQRRRCFRGEHFPIP